MAHKTPTPMLQLGHDGHYARNAGMPIAQVSRRTLQSAKEQRDRNFSAHHVRQMTKLAAQATKEQAPATGALASPKSTISARSSALNTFDAKKQLENAFKTRSSAAMALAPAARPMSSGAFKPRKIEPTRFRYFCALPISLCVVLMRVARALTEACCVCCCVRQTTAATCRCA